MAHSEALSQLSADEVNTITSVLKLWRSAAAPLSTTLQQLAANIAAEETLACTPASPNSEPCHVAFLKKLAEKWSAHATDLNATLEDYCALCGEFKFHGPLVAGIQVGRAGTARERKPFLAHLQKNVSKSAAVSLKRLEAEIRGIIERFDSAPEEAADELNEIFALLPDGDTIAFSGPVNWCTFRNPNRDGEPFVAPLNTSEAIRSSLGLGLMPVGAEILLITFDPSKMQLHKPTICDSGNYYFFRPTSAAEPHGWTAPLDAANTPQPEAVHATLLSDVDGLTIRVIL